MSGIIIVDPKKMDQYLKEDKVEIPFGLTTEEKRSFIIAHGNNDLKASHHKVIRVCQD